MPVHSHCVWKQREIVAGRLRLLDEWRTAIRDFELRDAVLGHERRRAADYLQFRIECRYPEENGRIAQRIVVAMLNAYSVESLRELCDQDELLEQGIASVLWYFDDLPTAY